MNGVADATGPTSSLWFLPIALTGLYLFLSAVQFIPAWLMHYPVTVTDRNREGVYALGREMLPAIKVCTLLTLLGDQWGSVDAAARGIARPVFFVAIIAPVVLLFGLVIYYTLRLRAV